MSTETAVQTDDPPLYAYCGTIINDEWRALDHSADPDPLAETTKLASTGFWRRQYSDKVTRKQRFFDWAFGVVMPVVCFAADPFIFKGGGRPLLGRQTVFAYALSIAGIMAMLAWLLWGDRLKGFAAPVSGILTGGALAALVIGVILLPFSFIGLAVAIGALGFTPLFTCVIWSRTAARAWRAGGNYLEEKVLWHSVGLAALLSVVVPAVANAEIGRDALVELARLIR